MTLSEQAKSLTKEECVGMLPWNFTFQREPYLHQLQALMWAIPQKSIALFMKMRTGKSLVVLNWLKWNNVNNNILVVCINFPLCYNWVEEFDINYPELEGAVLKGTAQERRDLLEKNLNYYLINYEGLRVVKDELLSKKWDAIVLDESRRIKSMDAIRTKICLELGKNTEYKAILSGTPFVKLTDLFSQYLFLDGGETFGNEFFKFRNNYFYDRNKLNNIIKLLPGFKDPIIAHRLQASVKYIQNIRTIYNIPFDENLKPKPFISKGQIKSQDWIIKKDNEDEFLNKFHNKCIIFEKEDCLDLPPREYQKLFIELSGMQNKDYEKLMEKDGDLDIATLSKSQLENRFIKYSQITGGFIRDGEGEDLYYPQNPKLDTLMDIVEDSIDYTKITVFHNFVPEGRLIEKALDEKGIKYASMRSEIKDTTAEYYKFREEDDVRVMIAHPASGGIGLNFIVSSICIIYNIGFNLENILQAEERLHGPGQTKTVEYVYLIARDTLDEELYKARLEGISFIDRINHYKLSLKDILKAKNKRWKEEF